MSQTEQTYDHDIMVRLQGGDRNALSELYGRHSLYLRSVAARFVRDIGLAEDVVHDVFIEVWQHAGRYRKQRATVRTWIAMRVRSRCLDRLRTAQAHDRLTDGIMREAIRADSSAIDQQIDGRRAAAVAARTLSDAQRVVLEMGYYEGLTYAEVARSLGIPLGTVKSRMRGALRTLRAEFARAELARTDFAPSKSARSRPAIV